MEKNTEKNGSKHQWDIIATYGELGSLFGCRRCGIEEHNGRGGPKQEPENQEICPGAARDKMDFKAMWSMVKTDLMCLEEEMLRAGGEAPERSGFLTVLRMMDRAEEREFGRVYNRPEFIYW